MSQPTWVVGGSIDKELKLFERFTDRARRVTVLAQESARGLNHNYIGTEHILHALAAEGHGVGARALERLGISAGHIRAEIEKIVGRGVNPSGGHIPFTPRAKKILELSLRESLQLGHNFIGTEHLLLGLIREGEGRGAAILVSSGAELANVRLTVIQILSGYPGEKEAETATESEDLSASWYAAQDKSRASKESGRNASASVAHPDNFELRLEALRLALTACSGMSVGTVIPAAKAFAAYLAGGGQ
jgi:ATP-dependent Clp protease ATP-binding subunit ClpC